MQGCFLSLVALALFVFVVLTLIRWFEATIAAVEQRTWDRVALLVLVPFAVWFFPSRVAAGRPNPVPRHEPVKGMGTLPKTPKETPAPLADEGPGADPGPVVAEPVRPAMVLPDEAPPGTPKEFLGMPVIPPKPKKKSSIDPDKIEKLRQKMRDQGMLDE